jgi:glycosyltransferase involved in cell wall biosynthesis
LVIGAGYADFRKGVDLFLQCASDICLDNNVVHVLWVGAVDLRLAPYLEHEIQARKLEGRVRFTGFRNDLATILQFVDVFLQTSREDPFPSVVLEAMRAGVPVLAFRGAGGIDDLLNQGIGGFLIDRFDPRSMARACLRLLSEPEQRNAMGMAGKQLMNEHYIFDAYVADLIRLARLRPPNISVIVPNFNYLRYLRVRINSILTQTYPIHEIILLDDASTDGSKEELQRIADELRGKMSVLVFHNEINSGSVMDQWARGVAAATGDLVWIAEADDLADPDFASELARTFDDQDVLFSYAQSRQIDSDGNVLAENYHAYTDPIDPVHWHMDGLEGPEDLIRYHAIKNCIPNVSAVLFRRQGLLDAITAGKPYQVAGDWRCYLTLMEMGRVAFRARTLNSHRRHQASITGSLKAERHYREVVETQEWVLSRHPGAHVLKSAMMEYRKHLLDYLGLSHECDGSAS